MAAKKVNKNLVAGLTAAGVVLAVTVVGVAVINAAAKDPQQLAAKAEMRAKAGDLRGARDYYVRAFDVHKEAHYLVKAAECSQKRGEMGDMFGLLTQASAQAPDDPAILTLLLERLWDVRSAGYPQWRMAREQSELLLKIQPENVLALVTHAEALDALAGSDEGMRRQAREDLERAKKADPKDARLALVWATSVLRDGNNAAREALRNGRRAEAQTIVDQARSEAEKIALEILKADPKASTMRTLVAQIYANRRELDRARQVLEEGLRLVPEDVELGAALSRLLFAVVRERVGGDLARLDEAARKELADTAQRAMEHAQKVVSIEPAYYDVYTTIALLKEAQMHLDGRWDKDRATCVRDVLDTLYQPLAETLTLRTFRAQFGDEERARLVMAGFDAAMDAYRRAPDDALRNLAKEYVKKFLDEAQARYAQSILVPIMKGQYAILEGDYELAIRQFEEAELKPGSEFLAFQRVARERLAALYRQKGVGGLALKYTDLAIDTYRQADQTPSLALLIQRVQLLNELDRPDEALDTADQALALYPDERALLEAKSAALTLLGRPSEGQAVLKALGSDPAALMAQARLAAYTGKYAEAERLLLDVLDQQPNDASALRLLVQVLVAGERQAEGAAILAELRPKVNEAMARSLDAYVVFLSEKDPQARDRKLLELIQSIPDDYERAGEAYNYFARREEWDQAAAQADAMERLRPDEELVLRVQFDLATRREQWDRAEQYVRKLAAANADQVQGAMFRGELQLRRGNHDAALAEFRAAERDRPRDAQLKIRIAQALLAQPRPDYAAAESALRQAVEFDPRDFVANKLLYMVYERTNRRADGQPYLDAAASLNASDPYIAEQLRWVQDERDPHSAIANREQVRAREPGNIPNLVRLAELYKSVGEKTKAEEALRAAIAADPVDRSALSALAEFLAVEKRREDGEKLIREYMSAVQDSRAKLDAYRMLAVFYERAGDVPSAESAFVEATRRVGELIQDGDMQVRAHIAMHNELADFYRRKNRLLEGIEVYQKLLAIVPGTDAYVAARQEARRDIAVNLVALGRYGEAEEQFAAYRKDYPNEIRGQLIEGEYLARRGGEDRMRRAFELLSNVISGDPDNAWALYLRGAVNIELRKYVEALDDLTRSKQLAPRAFDCVHRIELARTYELMERYSLAEAELKSVLDDRPNDMEIVQRLINLFKNSRQEEALLTFINERIAQEPTNPLWSYQLGQILMSRRDFSAAVAPIQRTVELTEGKNTAATTDLLRALTRANRPKEAVQYFEGMQEENKSPSIRAAVARAYLLTQQQDRALDEFGKALSAAAKSDLDLTRFAFSEMIQALGDGQACEMLKQALDQAQDEDSKLNLGITRIRYEVETPPEERVRAANQEAGTILASGLPPTSRYYIEAGVVQARALGRLGDPAGAVGVYEKLLESQPNNPIVLNNLAYVLSEELDRAAEAEPYALRAREAAPANPNILDTVGVVFLRKGALDQAESVLLEALRLDPDHLPARWHLSEVYLRNQKKVEAVRTLERLRDAARAKFDTEYLDKAVAQLEALK